MASKVEMSQKFSEILGLKWKPVAVKLIKDGEPLPKGIASLNRRLRHCQSVMLARKGKTLLMTPDKHACPDGSALLGMTKMPEKLANGKLYMGFGKFKTITQAKRMVEERPSLEAKGGIKATWVSPLDEASFTPDVIVFTVNPEQAMWFVCAMSYATGERSFFNTSGFNAMCIDVTLTPYLTGKPNFSFGCHGARGSTDLGENEMLVGIPWKMIPPILESLSSFPNKLIVDQKKKVWNLDEQLKNETIGAQPVINLEKCNGCGICVDMCVMNCYEVANGKARVVNAKACVTCDVCKGYCPNKAIEIKSSKR